MFWGVWFRVLLSQILIFSTGEWMFVGAAGVFIVSIDKFSSCDQSMRLSPSIITGIWMELEEGMLFTLSVAKFDVET